MTEPGGPPPTAITTTAAATIANNDLRTPSPATHPDKDGARTSSSSSPPPPPPASLPKRIQLTNTDLTATDWSNRWKEQDNYVTYLETKLQQQEGELDEWRKTTEKVRAQLVDSQQRERVLVRRLAAKEQETQDYVCQLNELKSAQSPSSTVLIRSTLLDPAANCIVQHLRHELLTTRAKLEDTQNELAAWKFTPDSNTGKRLMAKCRLLYQENEELGKLTSSGRIAKLESDLALQKGLAEEVRQSQNELDLLLADLDEDVDGMQSTIMYLQQELRKAKEMIANGQIQKDVSTMKMGVTLANGRSNGDSGVGGVVALRVGGAVAASGVVGGGGGGKERTNHNDDDEDSDSSDGRRGGAVKRVRRSSVLSIDYNEEDVIGTNGDTALVSDQE